MQQQTLKETIKIEGIGLHSGCPSVLRICPAECGTGIVFRRQTDGKIIDLPARYDMVVDTKNCTCLGKDGVLVGTIEHLMAVLYALGIDNALIECSDQELPVLDGSGAVLYQLLQTAEKERQSAERVCLKVLKPVVFEDEKGNFATLKPLSSSELSVRFDIEFTSAVVGHQVFDGVIDSAVFEREIAPARTFCEKYQIDYLQSIGLIKGGSLENAVVLDGDKILNPEGFRVRNECVNHKVLDAIGDLYTSGYRILGRFEGFRSGHYHNNGLLKNLFADSANYKLV